MLSRFHHLFQLEIIRLKLQQQDGSSSLMFFKISDDIISKPTNPSVQGLSVILDNSVYNPGDMIKVTGFGKEKHPNYCTNNQSY